MDELAPLVAFTNTNIKTTLPQNIKQKINERKRLQRIYNIENNKEAIGEHFNSKGHALHHLSIQIIEKVIPDTVNYRLERESMWIRKLESKKPRGLNIND